MALIDPANRTLRVRVVYTGPAGSGKTTNLRQIAALAPAHARGELVSIEASDQRTLLRDDLPLDLGEIEGWRVLADLSSVPGQPALTAERQAVLAGADAVVFVADSDPARQQPAAACMAELRALLQSALRPEMPVVLQINKRDLGAALPEDAIAQPLGAVAEAIPAVAVSGEGVFETLRAACRLAVRNA
ncbi:MAG: GTP-binding protein [Thermomicrobiales bacterium]